MTLDHRTIRLIAVGAALGANCQSCLQTNVAKALEAGAVEQEIAGAIEIGKMVRKCAAAKMDELASRLGWGEPSFTIDPNSGCGCEAAALADEGGKMAETQKSIPRYTGIAWGLLLILWGLTILFDFIPFGVGLVGTGLIFLGANWVRARNHQPVHPANTIPGILALTWGGLELARPILHQLLGAVDLDWAIFAIMLVVLGLTLLGRELLRNRQAIIRSSR